LEIKFLKITKENPKKHIRFSFQIVFGRNRTKFAAIRCIFWALNTPEMHLQLELCLGLHRGAYSAFPGLALFEGTTSQQRERSRKGKGKGGMEGERRKGK